MKNITKNGIEKIISRNLYIFIFVLISLSTTTYSFSNIMGDYLNSDANTTNNDNWSLSGDYTFQSADGNSVSIGTTVAKLEGEIVSELFGDFSFGFNPADSDIEFKKTSRNDCGTGTTYSISGMVKSVAWGDMNFEENDSYYCPFNGQWYGKLYSQQLGYKEVLSSINDTLGASFNLESQLLVKGLIGTDQTVNIEGDITNTSYDNIQSTNILQISIPKSDITKNINKNIEILTKNINPETNNTISNFSKNTYYFNYEGEGELTPSNEDNKGKIVMLKKGNYNTSNLSNYQIGISGEKNVIVKGGNVYINADIYNVDKNSILVIVAQRDDTNMKNGGNIYINPNVTNIDAVLIAEGSIINYNGNVIIDSATNTITSTEQNKLRNQLYIYGTTFTKNSIGTGESPYGSDGYIKYPTDLSNGSDKYDFNKLRSFDLIVSNTGTLDCPSSTNELVPRLNDTMNAKKYAWAGKKECFNTDLVVSNLRGINRFNPVIIEYNPIISTKPPFLLSNN